MTSLEEHLRPTADEVAQTLRDIAAGADPGAATAVIRSQAPATTRVLTEPARASDAGPGPGERTWRWGDARSRFSSRPVLAALTASVIVFVLTAAFLFGRASDESEGSSDIPSDTPSRLQEPLRDLHDAVNGR